MSAQVIHLPIKKPKKKTDGPMWICLHCDCDTFNLYEDGEVYCTNCTSKINNLEVKPKA